MVEKITSETLKKNIHALREKGMLHPELADELCILLSDLDSFSNWTEAHRYLTSKSISRLSGQGPISKFIRTITFAFDKILSNNSTILDSNELVSSIHISEADSGCSHYRGKIIITAQRTDQSERIILEGPFLWDCARHGIPQSEAAQQLGFQCMVIFPDAIPIGKN